jgi:hypothetical protein
MFKNAILDGDSNFLRTTYFSKSQKLLVGVLTTFSDSASYGLFLALHMTSVVFPLTVLQDLTALVILDFSC